MTASLALPSGLPVSWDRILQLPWPIPCGGDSLLAPPSRILRRPLPAQAVIHSVGAALAPGGFPLSLWEERQAQLHSRPHPCQRPLVCCEQSQGQNCALERSLLSLTFRLPGRLWPELWKVHGTPDDVRLNIFPDDLLVPPAKPLQSPGLHIAKLPGHLDAQRGPE